MDKNTDYINFTGKEVPHRADEGTDAGYKTDNQIKLSAAYIHLTVWVMFYY